MSARDPNIPAQLSQSLDLDNAIKLLDRLYCNSQLPVCIRNQFREVIYKNDAFHHFFHPASKDYAGFSFDKDEIELELSSIELESFMMGPGTAICRTFSFKGEYYQLRIEIRVIDNALFAVWFINYFPDYKALFKVRDVITYNGFNLDAFLSELTTRQMVTLSFYMIGFHVNTISKALGVSEAAVSNRMSSVKNKLKSSFIDFDEFRVYCLKENAYFKMAKVVLKILNVNGVLNK
ncbi:LuxR C-terminal-related transcriptional regulator [Enterobacter hormaechei]|uniref:LuxR C-terminal-related transcriptional regulator n=1 Tax=Enterobacter hormaechei TaxID=158836 RepID=UPI001E64BB2F|nr:LuxR C-terminal-related transcriptional regulator [Enterobacter hormaechei]EKW3905717.1 PAS fold family protein [Enterobacter hormaechei]MCB4925152.1 LuxR C-terminal-related transcriptional regulator [Enterobacter hormaechei]